MAAKQTTLFLVKAWGAGWELNLIVYGFRVFIQKPWIHKGSLRFSWWYWPVELT